MAVNAPTWTTDRARTPARSPGHPPARRRRPGFHVVEALLASAVLAIAVVGVAGPLAASSEHASAARERAGALALARQLMEQIAARPVCNGAPTPLGPTLPYEDSPAKYDTIGDFNGYYDTPAVSQSTIGTPNGTYTRTVWVQYQTSTFDPSAAVTDYALVTVTVTTPRKETLSVYRLFCKDKAVR